MKRRERERERRGTPSESMNHHALHDIVCNNIIDFLECSRGCDQSFSCCAGAIPQSQSIWFPWRLYQHRISEDGGYGEQHTCTCMEMMSIQTQIFVVCTL